jgi:hypothetical protein
VREVKIRHLDVRDGLRRVWVLGNVKNRGSESQVRR